jgi:hypothetical protein
MCTVYDRIQLFCITPREDPATHANGTAVVVAPGSGDNTPCGPGALGGPHRAPHRACDHGGVDLWALASPDAAPGAGLKPGAGPLVGACWPASWRRATVRTSRSWRGAPGGRAWERHGARGDHVASAENRSQRDKAIIFKVRAEGAGGGDILPMMMTPHSGAPAADHPQEHKKCTSIGVMPSPNR